MGMAAEFNPVSVADSTGPYRLVRHGKRVLENLNFQRKQLMRAIESVQRLLDLRQRRFNAGVAAERFPNAAIVRFSAARRKQAFDRADCPSRQGRSNLLYFPSPRCGASINEHQ